MMADVSNLFSGKGQSPRYLAVRNDPSLTKERRECLRLWKFYERFADSNFVDQFSRDFDGRFWEMYLAERLHEHHPSLAPNRGGGPDFLVPLEAGRVSIEATVATRGKGADAVPDSMSKADDDDSVPFDECAMRITNALSSKANANDAKIHAKLGPYVIAINLPYPQAWVCSFPPLSAVATLGAGGTTFSLTAGKSTIHYRGEIEKKLGSKVQTTGFHSTDFAHVSAIIVANVDLLSSSYSSPAIEILHNPNSENPLPQGWLPIGREYWLENDTLCSSGNW